MTARSVVLSWLVLAAASASVQAQQAAASLKTHEIVISGGPILAGGYDLGDSIAELRTNATGAQPPPFTLFAVSSTMEPLAGVEASLGYALTPSLTIEGGGWFARANIAPSLSRDAEAMATSIDGEKLHQFILSGGVAWQLPWSPGHKVSPFVAGGGGYLRQLHEERTLVESGQLFYIGGGVRYFIRGGDQAGRSIGVRSDVRALWRTPGIDFEDKTRVFPTLTFQLFIGM